MSKNEYGEAKSGALREKLGALPYDLIPFQEIANAFSRVAEHGAKKYAPWNWSKGLPRVQVLGSLLRHSFAYLRGEERDKDSGLLHTDHILWNAAVLSHGQEWGLEDGRRGEPDRGYKAAVNDLLEDQADVDMQVSNAFRDAFSDVFGDLFGVDIARAQAEADGCPCCDDQDDEMIARVLEEVNAGEAFDPDEITGEVENDDQLLSALIAMLTSGRPVSGSVERVGDVSVATFHIDGGTFEVGGNVDVVFDSPEAFATFADGGVIEGDGGLMGEFAPEFVVPDYPPEPNVVRGKNLEPGKVYRVSHGVNDKPVADGQVWVIRSNDDGQPIGVKPNWTTDHSGIKLSPSTWFREVTLYPRASIDPAHAWGATDVDFEDQDILADASLPQGDDLVAWASAVSGVPVDDIRLIQDGDGVTIWTADDLLTFGDMLQTLLLQGQTVQRATEPWITYEIDAAEDDLVIWSMNSRTDDLLKHDFSADQLVAIDWEAAS